MKMLKDIERLVKKFNIDSNPEKNEEILSELLQAQAEHLKSKKSVGQRHTKTRSFVVEYPRFTLISSLAAVFVALFSCAACFVLTRKVENLEHELELARRDLVVARTEGKLEEARNVRQETISTLHHRVDELEERIPRIPSARRVCYPDEYYYSRNSQDRL